VLESLIARRLPVTVAKKNKSRRPPPMVPSKVSSGVVPRSRGRPRLVPVDARPVLHPTSKEKFSSVRKPTMQAVLPKSNLEIVPALRRSRRVATRE